MPVIYEPSGKAKEYSELACNVYLNCPFGCTYCYVPAMLHKTKETFHKDGVPRVNFLKNLEIDALKLEMR